MSSPSRDCAHVESPKICKTNWTASENLQNVYLVPKSQLNFVVFNDIDVVVKNEFQVKMISK